MRQFSKKLIFFSSSVFVIDRITKIIAVQFVGRTMNLGSFVHLQTSYNSGIAWGIAAPFWLMILLTPFIFFLLIIWWKQAYAQNKKWESIASSAILVGAVSNLIDRIFYSGVIDFIAIGWWPVFNIADILISVGVLLGGVQILRYETLSKT